MSDLKKWFPFKFNRNHNDEPREDKTAIAQREQWNDPFVRMEREMNQMMRGIFGGGVDDWFLPQMRAARTPSWFGDFSPARYSPLVDVTNEANHLVVSAELPGMSQEDVEVTFQDGTLTLKGQKRHERQTDEDGCYRTERFYGAFQRTIPLPADVDANGAEARFNDGVLTVKFPKIEIEDSGPRRIALS